MPGTMPAIFPRALGTDYIIMAPPVQAGTWRLPEVKELAKFTQLVKGKAGNVFKSAQIP